MTEYLLIIADSTNRRHRSIYSINLRKLVTAFMIPLVSLNGRPKQKFVAQLVLKIYDKLRWDHICVLLLYQTGIFFCIPHSHLWSSDQTGRIFQNYNSITLRSDIGCRFFMRNQSYKNPLHMEPIHKQSMSNSPLIYTLKPSIVWIDVMTSLLNWILKIIINNNSS